MIEYLAPSLEDVPIKQHHNSLALTWPLFFASWMLGFWLIYLIVRIAIAVTGLPATFPPAALAMSFATGVWKDLFAGVLACTPLAIAALLGERTFRVAIFVVLGIVCILIAVELFFWYEFSSRPDRLVFHYLSHPQEVFSFLEDQFYLSFFAIPFAILVWGLGKAFTPFLPNFPAPRSLLGLWCVAAVAIVLGNTMTSVEQSRSLTQLATNGYLNVAHAALLDPQQWVFGHTDSDPPPSSLPPHPAPKHVAEKPQHIVLIIEESFAGPTWQKAAQRQRYLPQFDTLRRQGLYFSNFYATGSRTTRGLEALLNGYPPLPGIATNQRPGFTRLPSLTRALNNAGFHSVFLYGGWPHMSNFQSYWQALGFDDILDRYDFSDDLYQTSWGVADEFLFERAIEEMRTLTATEQHVLLTTLTVSHHRPYDFPAGRVPFDEKARRSEHALAYADWSLDHFINLAKQEPWFERTLFIIVADHGPRILGDAFIPVEGYRIPMLFYAPALVPPAEHSHLASAMSLPMTIIDLMGLPNSEGFYGTSLLYQAPSITPVEYDYHVGLLTHEELTVLTHGQRLASWRRNASQMHSIQPNSHTGKRLARLFGHAHHRFYK